MSVLRFLHITDTHFNIDYTGTRIERLHRATGITLTEQLKIGVADALARCPDAQFVLLSGDLVHEGEVEDYAALRELLGELFGEIPIYPSLGNHDNNCFWRGWLGQDAEDEDARYDSVVTLPGSGLRIITLDSRGGPYGSGVLSEKQLAWLGEVLSDASEAGSLLMMHHTPNDGISEPYLRYQLQSSQELYEVVEGSDIIAVFAGHTHMRYESEFAGIACYTSPSIGFGIVVGEEDDRMTWNDDTGYNICELEYGESQRSKLAVTAVDIEPPESHSAEVLYSELTADKYE